MNSVGISCLSSSQSEDGKGNAHGTDPHREYSGSELEIWGTVIDGVASSGVGGTRRGGLGAAGRDRRRRHDAAGRGEGGVDDRGSVGDAVGRSGDLGLVRDGGDCSQRLRGLSVGLNLTAWIGIDAGEVLVGALARFERAVLGVIGGVVEASDTIVNVFAVPGSVGTSGVASLEAEETSAKETKIEGMALGKTARGGESVGCILVPLDDLFVVGFIVTAPRVREDETAKGVSSEISTVRVQLASRVVRLEVGLRLVDKTDDLDVIRGLHELNALESTAGDKAGAVTRFGTPCDSLVFCFADSGWTIGWSPDAEI